MNIIKIFNSFRLFDEKEKYHLVVENVEKGIHFRGTNLWILIFAIFIASLGLNVNSTAVIIGAMLISPLMGPIMGVGLSLGINDLQLLRKSLQNYFFALFIGLVTSTIYFSLTPINDAHSEILARTQPNIYDVLIAFFGGLAGILAVSSKTKGNVIPGVAIATALIPPLCTAGYGLATWQWKYFGGAFYLFLINSVFIAVATLITVRYLRFPVKHLLDEKSEVRNKRIVWLVTLCTIIPSIYFGYTFIQDGRFVDRANTFIERDSRVEDEYLLNKKIDASSRRITLTYGGAKLTTEKIQLLTSRFQSFGFDKNTTLKIDQGFSFLSENNNNDGMNNVLTEKDALILTLQHRLDTLNKLDNLGTSIFKELKVSYPEIKSVVLTSAVHHSDSTNTTIPICIVYDEKKIEKDEVEKMYRWLKVRLSVDTINLIMK